MRVAGVAAVLVFAEGSPGGAVLLGEDEISGREGAKSLGRGGRIDRCVGKVAEESKFNNGLSDLSWNSKEGHGRLMVTRSSASGAFSCLSLQSQDIGCDDNSSK